MSALKHRGEVIEAYPQEGKAAVRFSWRGRDRFECVPLYIGPDAKELTIGMRGWATYSITASTGLWSFEPFKYQKSDFAPAHLECGHLASDDCLCERAQ